MLTNDFDLVINKFNEVNVQYRKHIVNQLRYVSYVRNNTINLKVDLKGRTHSTLNIHLSDILPLFLQ